MGLLNRLTFRSWPRPATPELTMDLSRPSLGDVRPAEDQSAVSRHFGPPSSYRQMVRHGLWLYPAWGITFEVERGRVAGFSATVLAVEGTPPRLLRGDWRPYPGEVILRGTGARRPAERLRPETVWESLGAPQQIEEGVEQVVLFYRFGGWGMDVEFLADGRFTHVSVFVIRHESR